MAPKFKGNSDDWLDDQVSVKKTKRPGASKPSSRDKRPSLPLEKSNAVIAEVFPSQCRAHPDAGAGDLLCTYRRALASGIFASGEGARERTPVAVGDRVLVHQVSPEQGVVEGVCERTNFLYRPAPGRATRNVRHVIAANVDLLVIVASVSEPVFSAGLIDRYLVAASVAGIPCALCITKADLLGKDIARPWELYSQIGVPIAEVSVRRELGLSTLRERLIDKTVVFCGHSGVGKTTLLNALIGSEIGKVGMLSHATGKGMHTTTGAVLLKAEGKSQWIDTPGVREFGLDIPPEELTRHFPEFRDLSCTQHGCTHEEQPECQAKEQPRFASYSRILQSLREQEAEKG